MKYISSIERYAIEKGWSEGMEKGILEGMERGKEVGVLEGMEKGKAEGLEEGLLKGRLEVAQRLVASGMSKAEAASFAGVSVEML